MDLFSAFLSHKAISTDTRKVLPNSIFFALKGENFNGNKFAAEALKGGAAFVVIDEPQPHLPDEQVFLVEDSLRALQKLARQYRETFSGTVIGLTGSNGKTTCKELFRDVLATTYSTKATIGNLNNHIGVPLTLLATPADTEMVIVEMGANHQKEIELLSSICLPDIGFITNYGKAHLDGFGGVEGVIKGKSELFDNLRKRNKLALVNCEDAKQLEKSSDIDRKTFGNCANADIYIQNTSTTHARAKIHGTKINSQLTGSFHYNNIAAAVALGIMQNVPLAQIKQAIENYKPEMNRSEWRRTKKNTVLLDAYNANPDSMQAAIKAFEALHKPNSWYILGDMFELGDYTFEEHQRIVNMLDNADAKHVIVVGNAFLDTTTPAHFTKLATTEATKNYLNKLQLKDCTILLKGSRGMKLESLLDFL